MGSSVDVWTRFAEETGKATTEFLQRFSLEQQKLCSTWLSSLENPTTKDRRTTEQSHEERARLETWKRHTEELSAEAGEALRASLAPPTAIFQAWMATLLPQRRDRASPEAQAEGTRAQAPASSSSSTNGRRWIEKQI